MAFPPGLTRRTAVRLALLVAAVLVAHGVALHWLSRLQAQAALLKPMAMPMYTRVLVPEKAPPPPPVAAAEPAPTKPTARLRPARSTPRATTSTQADAGKPTEPSPAPEVVAQAPAEATVPTPPASAPAATTEPPAAAASAPATAASGPSRDAAATWPPDTRLRYKLSGYFRGDLHGDARVLWQRQDERYQVRVEVEIGFLAKLTMTSQGEVGSVLQPQAYEELRNGNARGLRLGESEILLANGNVVRKPEGVQDTASQFVELTHRFATGREQLEVGRAVSFHMARPGAVDLWTYDIVKREVLATRLGPIEAFHLVPRPIANPRGNITAEMWFAPALQYLPVKIRVNMGEEARIDLLVEAIDQK
jgi:hypothetical protein